MPSGAAPFTDLDLNGLFASAGIDPKDVIVLRNQPPEKELRRTLPWLAADRPDLFTLYLAVQKKVAGGSMAKARYIAAMVGLDPAAATFAAFYEVKGSRQITEEEFWTLPGQDELKTRGLAGSGGKGEDLVLLDLEPTPLWSHWAGKLTVDWPPPELSWWRRAERNVMRVRHIAEDSRFVPAMPPWDELVLTWEQLKAMPTPWRARISQWRGIYFIYNTSQQWGYVGSACGADNILGRWLDYAQTGHGGNVGLRDSRPEDLKFSILQRTSPDMIAAEVEAVETTWKKRLHTRDFGLNRN